MSSKRSNQIVTNPHNRTVDMQPQAPHKATKLSETISLIFQRNRHLLTENQQLMQHTDHLSKQNQQLFFQKEWYKNKLQQLQSIINQFWDDVPISIHPPFTEITEINNTIRLQTELNQAKPCLKQPKPDTVIGKHKDDHIITHKKRLFKLPPLCISDCESEDLLMDLDNLIDFTDNDEDDDEEMIDIEHKKTMQYNTNHNRKRFIIPITTEMMIQKTFNSSICEILDIANLSQQRKHLRKLIKKMPDCIDTIQFYIANSYEREGNKVKAIAWYDSSLKNNYKNRNYYETLTVYHKGVCILETKGIDAIQDDMLILMIQSWRNTVANEAKYELIRAEWKRRGESVFELIGAARCCCFLARYYEDKLKSKQESSWNDISLIWYKRALNILEKLQVIVIKLVGIDEVVETSICDKERMLFLLNGEGKRRETVERKRLNEIYSDIDYLETAEDVIQNYMQCIIERFRKEQYGTMEDDIENYECFVDFHNLNGTTFELYLEYELNSMFEINHYYFKHAVSKIHNNGQEIADVYINYASYLTDVRRKYEIALLLYQHALVMNKDAIAYWNIADIYEKMERYDEAVKYLDLVVEYTEKDCGDYGDEYEQMLQEVDEVKKRISEKRSANTH